MRGKHMELVGVLLLGAGSATLAVAGLIQLGALKGIAVIMAMAIGMQVLAREADHV